MCSFLTHNYFNLITTLLPILLLALANKSVADYNTTNCNKKVIINTSGINTKFSCIITIQPSSKSRTNVPILSFKQIVMNHRYEHVYFGLSTNQSQTSFFRNQRHTNHHRNETPTYVRFHKKIGRLMINLHEKRTLLLGIRATIPRRHYDLPAEKNGLPYYTNLSNITQSTTFAVHEVNWRLSRERKPNERF